MKRDLRSVLFLSMFLTIFGHLLDAQTTTPISSVRVYSSPTGARFMVDGLMYSSSQTFLWPAGSKHTLQFPQSYTPEGLPGGYQESLDGNSRFTLSSWTLSNGVAPTGITDLTIVADPGITSVVMSSSVSYRVRLRFSSFPVLAPGLCSTGVTPRDAPRSGLILVGATCYGSDADFFAGAGPLAVLAYPFPGWVFGGWSTNGAPPVGTSSTVGILGPTTLVAQFILAKRVSFRTEPAGLNLLIDRTPTPTLPGYGPPTVQGQCSNNLSLPPLPPMTMAGLCFGDFDFIPGSAHTLGAASPQYDLTGNMWILDSFSNGLKPNDTMVVSRDISKADLITAKFVPGVQASFLTNPGGLKLLIDGRSNWITYNFAWGSGTSHTAVAADQMDAKGRRWTFKGWSNGGSASQTFPVSGAIRWTANFDVQPQVIVQSNPSGLALRIDGTNCTTPCTLDRPAGTLATISAPAAIAISDSSRLLFTSWSDGAASSNRTVSFDGDQRVLTLNYQTQFRLAAMGDPSQGVSFTYDPPTPDQYYPQDTGVTVKAQTKGGYRFRRWDGDLSGSFGQGTLLMGAPKTVVALLDRVPFLAPAGIHNAAGVTPAATVAPGSLIAIAGESLSTDFQVGRTNPLAQAIGNITVTVNDRLLPLVYVAPQEIRAQMLSDLPDGDYGLIVHSAGQPDVVGQFTIARNSPGLFPAPTQPDADADIPIAWAIHADGTAITADLPALHGEVITLYGTGFGLTSGALFDGFPAISDFKLQDQLQIQAGDLTLDPTWSGALGGQIGMMAVKFKVTDDLPTAVNLKIAVIVNGKTSNTVLLPLQ